MSRFTEADVRDGQLWRDPFSPFRWRVHSVVREHLIGDLYETTVTLVDELGTRDTLRIPATVLLQAYALEERP